LKGRYHTFAITEKSMRQGIEFFQLAVTADPNYALAYADMADAYRRLGIVGFDSPKEGLTAAKLFAKKALELDDSLAEAYSVLGWVGFFYEWDWKGAEINLKRAIELNPNNSDVHVAYAHFLSCSARHDEAIAEIRKAKVLSPTTQILLTMESQFLLFARRDEEAFRQVKKTLDIDPDFWVALNQLGRIYSFQKRYDLAIAELTKAKQMAPAASDPCMQLGYAFAITGDHKKAYEILDEMRQRSKERFVSFYSFAMIYNGLGDQEKALNLLQKSVIDHEPQLAFIKIDRRWDNLRSDSRFVNILKQMNW
jgi:tetratricopeptide (TPR) repeat protein